MFYKLVLSLTWRLALLQVLIDPADGLCFKHRSDRKVICVNPGSPCPGSQSSRLELHDPTHLQVTLFDHMTRAPRQPADTHGSME